LLAGLDQASSIDTLVSLNHLVHDRVRYIQRMEAGVQTPEQTALLASGSCRDSAWLLVQAARALGFAARFVSGYLIQLFDPANPADNLHEDGADLHAWAEMYLPGAGWIGFDATSGLVIGPGHIPLACTADPATAAPISGSLSATAAVDFTAVLSVVRMHGPESMAVATHG
jgi:transglutaminase-like putative cysteine protease